jgi:hypothetical protein
MIAVLAGGRARDGPLRTCKCEGGLRRVVEQAHEALPIPDRKDRGRARHGRRTPARGPQGGTVRPHMGPCRRSAISTSATAACRWPNFADRWSGVDPELSLQGARTHARARAAVNSSQRCARARAGARTPAQQHNPHNATQRSRRARTHTLTNKNTHPASMPHTHATKAHTHRQRA